MSDIQLFTGLLEIAKWGTITGVFWALVSVIIHK